MSGRQKQRTKGNVKPSSSARTAELMAREAGGAMGFVGFGAMSGDLGYVPHAPDDSDAQLDGDFRMVLRKLTKKDVVTKLKALQEFGTLCKEKDQDTVTATLPHWSRMYGRLAIDHDKRVREATQQTFQLLVEQVKRNLAPQLRSLMGPWLVAQCDTFAAARSNAKAAFETAFPPHKQPDAIGYCSVQVIQYLQGNLFKETPTTLSDANTTTPEEQEEKYLRVISSSLLALGELISMVTEKYRPKVSEHLSEMLSDGKLWKMGKHKNPMVRAAFYSLLGFICKHMPSLAEAQFARIAPALLGNLNESETAVMSALWETVLILVSQLPDCWSHVNARKAALPKLWLFLRHSGHGCASTIYPSLLPFLSKIPADVIGEGVDFYREFFSNFKTGLCQENVSKSPAELEAVVKAYMECLRYVISRNLSLEENCKGTLTMLIEDHILVLLASSIVELDSNLSATSLYSQTSTLISYLQKQTITNPNPKDESETSQAASSSLTVLWDSITNLCLTQVEASTDISSDSVNRIVLLLCNLVSPERAEQLLNFKTKVGSVTFDLAESGTRKEHEEKDDAFGTSTVESQERTKAMGAETNMDPSSLSDISDDLVNLSRRLTNSTTNLSKTAHSLSHTDLLSKLLFIFPIAPVFNEILLVNAAIQEQETGGSSFDGLQEAAMGCFQQVFLPWVLNSEGDDSANGKQVTGCLVDMIHVVLYCVENSLKAAILDEICCGTRSPLVLHKLVTKIQTQPDKAFLTRWLKSATFGDKVVQLADSLCHMTTDSQSAIRKQSWDLISLGLSTDANGEPNMNAVYAEKVLLKFTEALQASKVKGHHEEQTYNAVSFICDVASHFFSGVEGCMVIKSTEKLLFALFQIGCTDTVLSGPLREKINNAWETGVVVLVKQNGGLLNDDGFLHQVACWIKTALLNNTHTLHRCHHLAQAVYSLCLTVLSSLPESDGDASALHIIEELLSIMIPTSEEWESNDRQLSTKWQESVLLQSTLTCASLPSSLPLDTAQDELPTSIVLAAFVASLLETRDGGEQPLPWQYAFMEAAILEMVHALEWCKGMMGLKAQSKVNSSIPPPVHHIPAYCQQIAPSLETTLESVLKTLNAEEWKALISQAISKSLASGGLWSLSLGDILAVYHSSSTSASSQQRCNVYDMIGGPDRLTEMTETSLHTLECVIPYLTPDQVLEVLQINVAVLITSDTSVIPNINGGLGILSIITKCCLHPQWDRVTQYDLIISCVEQLTTWRDDWEQGFLFNCDLFEANTELIPVNSAIIRFLQQVVEKIPSSLASHHWDFILCSLVSWIQSCTENIKDLTTNISVTSLCSAVCDLLTSTASLFGRPTAIATSNLPSDLVTEWKEFFSEAAFTVLLPLLLELLDDIDLCNLTITQHHLLQSLCEAVSHTPQEHLLDNKLPAKLHAGSWLPDNLQTLTNTLCPLLTKPLRCVQLTAYQMLTKVISLVTKHDEEHLKESTKDEEEVTLTPPPGLKDILDSSEVLMESLLGDVPVGECVIMEPGSEAYHDTMVYMLGWRLYLAIFKAASAEIRASYAAHMRNTKRVEHLLENLFCLMPQVPSLSESSKESSNKSSSAKSSKSTQATMFTEEPRLNIKGGTPSSLEIQHQACIVYLSSLEELPAMVRQWWNSQDKRIAPLVEKFTSKYVSPVLCTRELQGVQSQPKAFDNMTVKARTMTWEVIATYAVEELSMDLVIQLATNHPLGVITVDSGQKVEVSQSQWRNWMLQLTTFLTHQNGSILDGLKLWKRNVDKRFEGVDDCMICFSVIHGSNYSLPKLTCKTCKKRFHSACLYKWFSTSNQSSCPLCRSPF